MKDPAFVGELVKDEIRKLEDLAVKLERGDELTADELALVDDAVKKVSPERKREALFRLEMDNPEAYARIMEIVRQGRLN